MISRLETRRVSYSRELKKLLLSFVDDVAPVSGVRSMKEVTYFMPIIKKEFRKSYEVLMTDLLRKQALLAYRDVKIRGLSVPDRSEWVEDFLNKFYVRSFKKKNLSQRIVAASNNLITQIKNEVHSNKDKTAEEINISVSRLLSGKRSSSSGVSPFYWSDRLLMGEAKRSYWDAYIDLSEKGDNVLVEWVMNPSCIHCSVCLSYSQEESPSLTGLKDSPKPGVYRAHQFPRSPHPWCGCLPRIFTIGS